MGIETQTAQQIFDRQASDVVNQLDELDPFVRNSLIRSILVAFSYVSAEIYATIIQLQNLVFWDTTEGDELIRWAAIFGITKNAATISTGAVTFTGVDNTTIPALSQFSGPNSEQYQTTESGQIQTTSLSVALTRNGSVVTATSTTEHGLASNLSVTVSGANETEYNGTFTITVTGLSTFTYTISGTPTSPATGAISAQATYANIACESINFGEATNLESGEAITLSSPISGVDDTGYVSFIGITGGTDTEDDNSLRDRFLDRVQKPVANFNVDVIIAQAKKVNGVTRVWVQTPDSNVGSQSLSSLVRFDVFAKATTASPHGLYDGQNISINNATQTEYNVSDVKMLRISDTEFGYIVEGLPTTPATGPVEVNYSVSTLGQVRVFFVRDNDGTGSEIIPSAGEINAVKEKLNEIRPADLSEGDLIVAGPIANIVNFAFSSITPDTTAMRTAIQDNLQSFFSSGTNTGSDLSKKEYDAILVATVDSGGNRLEDYTLTSPTTDISINPSEIPILGTVTFP